MTNYLDLIMLNDILMGSLSITLNHVNFCIECINNKLYTIQIPELREFYFNNLVLEARYFANFNGYNWNHLTDIQQLDLYQIQLMMHKERHTEL